ncbi:hypothetical protein EDO6_01791 [Paenibacillus xylanexedens]|nr:hypothetical protein EDO6_01791 [Paenibacillus xylanexedens]
MLFKISAFSRLSRVSLKTLRYYDQIGILKPRKVDHDTGYRYYSADQLLELNRIFIYKELGFTLPQITQLLQEHITLENIQGMFKLKRSEIQQIIDTEQAKLVRIEERMQLIEEEFEFEIGYFLTCELRSPLDPFQLRTLPAEPMMATIAYRSNAAFACKTCVHLATWIEKNNYQIKENEAGRELYLPLSPVFALAAAIIAPILIAITINMDRKKLLLATLSVYIASNGLMLVNLRPSNYIWLHWHLVIPTLPLA